MSEYIVNGVPMVEEVCTDLLEEAGIEHRENAQLAAETLVSPTEILLDTPADEELPELFRTHIKAQFQKLETEYDGLPKATTITDLEGRILGTIGLGLEGRLPGPATVPRHIDHAGQKNPPEWAAEELPATPLPTEAVPLRLLQDREFDSLAAGESTWMTADTATFDPSGGPDNDSVTAFDQQETAMGHRPSKSMDEPEQESTDSTEPDPVAEIIETLREEGYDRKDIIEALDSVFED